MSVLVYVVIGWLAMALWTAAGVRFAIGHVLPDAAVVTAVFVALRREPLAVTVAAVLLGYWAGRQALAPIGLHEAVLVACALTVYMTGGNLAGSGANFFAMAAGGTVMLYHVLLYVLMSVFGGRVGFTGWSTALLLPSALATAALAWVSHPVLAALERRLREDRRESLSW